MTAETNSCYLRSIVAEYGSGTRSNDDLVAVNPNWSAGNILSKVGINSRPIAIEGESALDIAERAAVRCLSTTEGGASSIDVLIMVTQSPEYILPSSACILQKRLGLSEAVAAFDVGLGCSGFNYALWLARAIVLARQGRKVLVLCAETYSRYCDIHDLSTVTLFGDGASAAVLQSDPENAIAIVGESVLGTDGSGANSLIIENGGGRGRAISDSAYMQRPTLVMDGPAVFRFALDRAQSSCEMLLQKTDLVWDDIDMVLCHQANRFMLQKLQRQFGLTEDKMPIDVYDVGNLSTASLPVHIARSFESGKLSSVSHSLAIGFGVGLSWGVTHLRWLQTR
jgi:3-oxoacyl-[acyl-carrier-protein] synthase-3